MADERLKIVIEAVDKASKELDGLKKQLGDVDKTTKGAGKSATGLKDNWKSLVTTAGLVAGGAVAVYGALKKVYDLGKEGASLEYAAGKFDRLAVSAGTTSDVLLRDLRVAVKGTRSDMELMASAGDFMSLGLAKTSDEVVRLTKVAGALNMDMNQLVLTLANKTTMRFDQLGVSIDGFDTKVKKLTESGMAADAAFTEAFLQQAESQISKVGNSADTNVGKIARMEAATKNLGDAFRLWFAPGVAAVAEGLADVITRGQRIEDMFSIQSESLTKNAKSFDEYSTAIIKTGIATEKYSKGELEMAIHAMMKYDESIEGVVPSVSKLGELTEDQLLVLAKEKGYIDSVVVSLGGMSQSTFDIIQKWRTATPLAEDMNEALKGTAVAATDAAAATSAVADATNDADAAMRKYSDALLFKIASEGLSSEEALELARSMGLVDIKTVEATEKSAAYKKMLDDGAISLTTYNALVAGLAGHLNSLSDKTITVTYNQVVTGTAPGGTWRGTGGDGSTQESRPTGGPTVAGRPYRWQEYGYPGEVMVAERDGFVLSRAEAKQILAQSAGKGGSGAQINITVNGAADPQQTANLIGNNFRAALAMQGA